jgi:hypothetical protein
MATMSIKSGGSTLSTVGPDTIKHAFREIMDDEAKHVSFFEAALKKLGRLSTEADLQGARTIQSERFHHDVWHPREYRRRRIPDGNARESVTRSTWRRLSQSRPSSTARGICECPACQASQRKRRIR